MKNYISSFRKLAGPALILPVLIALMLNVSCNKKPKWNVVLLTLDTTRADRLRCYGYNQIETPALNGLAREGVLFEHAYSPVPLTLPAHTTIMSGTSPIYHGVIDNGAYEVPEELNTLAEVLKGHGYQTSALISATVLTRNFHLDQGFEFWNEDDLVEQETMGPLVSERKADTVTNAALKWLDEKSKSPFFLWVHYYDPHQLYNPPKEFAALYPEDYDGEIAFMDSEIKRLLDDLKARGVYDNTLVVAVGDHGESLFEHGEPSHGILIYNSTQHVPLIVRIPGFKEPGKRIKTVAGLDDIMPTILDYLGIPVPGKISGASLKSVIDRPAEEIPDKFSYVHNEYSLLHYSWAPLSAVIGPRYKYIKAPKPELYDLLSDPGELNNIVAGNEKLANQYRRKIEDFEGEWADGLKAKTAELDARQRKQIEDLGYIGQAYKGDLERAMKKDPKDYASIFIYLNDMHKVQAKGMPQDVLVYAEAILKVDPDNPVALQAKGDALAGLGRCDEAIEVYNYFTKVQADIALTRLKIAKCLIQQGGAAIMDGDHDKGMEYYRKAQSELDTASGMKDADEVIFYFLGRIAISFGDYEKAADTFNQPKIAESEYGHLGMAVLYSMTGRMEQAQQEFDKVKQMADKDKSVYWQEYADFLIRRRSFAEALDFIAKAIEEDPKMADMPPVKALQAAAQQGLEASGAAPAPAPAPVQGGTTGG